MCMRLTGLGGVQIIMKSKWCCLCAICPLFRNVFKIHVGPIRRPFFMKLLVISLVVCSSGSPNVIFNFWTFFYGMRYYRIIFCFVEFRR